MEQIKSKEMQSAKDIILKSFHFLERDYFYVPELKIEESKVFKEFMTIEYIHENRNRKVSVNYTKGKVYDDIKYTFDLNIVRLPYRGLRDFLSLSNYLQSDNQDFDTSLINHLDINEAEIILKKMAVITKDKLSEVLEGEKWYETFYPRKD